MSLWLGVLLSPALLCVTLLLAVFATWTSILAFSVLSLRAVFVYAELASVLLHNSLLGPSVTSLPSTSVRKKTPSSSAAEVYPRKSSNEGPPATAPEFGGLDAYGSGKPSRDFEGLGGWRMPSSRDEDALWTQINSRLELPIGDEEHQRNHRRSKTSSSLIALPLTTNPPTQSRPLTPARAYSPVEYFGHRGVSKSTSSLDATSITRTYPKRKASNSSGSSHSSSKLASMAAFQ